MVEKIFECKECGKKVKITDDKIPECCDKTMHQLPIDNCIQPHSAEYSGPFEEDKPCDDGRSG